MTLSETFSIVLVEPQDPINIGSVARAMMNLGFVNLRLVSPERSFEEHALRSACWAEKIVRDATIFETLEQAISDQQFAVGFSARSGKNRPTLPLKSWLTGTEVQDGRRIALVFGPEDCGLRQEHHNFLNLLVTIPSAMEYRCYNLAQAVLLVLYEIFTLQPSASNPTEVPTLQQIKQLDVMLDKLIEKSGFLTKGTPAEVPELLRGIFRRAPLRSERELTILLGFLSRLDKGL